MTVTPEVLEIKGLIAKKGHSLTTFCSECGISLSYMSLILNNKVKPSPKIARKIADSLEVSIEDIFKFKA